MAHKAFCSRIVEGLVIVCGTKSWCISSVVLGYRYLASEELLLSFA